MLRYVLARLLATIPVVIMTSMIIFGLMRLLPGDPVTVLIGQAHVDVSEETIARLRKDLGLDKSIAVQYVAWARRAVTGDFGRSVQSRQPVLDVLVPRILPTVQIGLTAWFIALAVGIPIGIVTATAPNSWKDWLGSVGALVGAAMPYFLVGGLLIYFVALRWGLLPASGFVSPLVDPVASAKTTVLPALTLALGLAAVITRQTRASFADVMQRAFIKTARAKGLHEAKVISNHAFKNAMLPVVTILGIQLATVFSGAVITETIFAVPGVGRLLVDSILSRDYPVVQAVVLFISLMVVAANLTVDIVYGFLDPRIREA
jgi:peptide/nickel transport system permease protein